MGMAEHTNHEPGQRLNQYHGATLVRRVQVLSVNGSTARVRALQGPLAGAEYDLATSDLRP